MPQDYAQAAAWYRKAADQGYAGAQYNLGVMYANGQGVPQDYVRLICGSTWQPSGTSDAGFHNKSVKDRDFVAAKMTPAQIAEAQRMASEWKPTK